MASFILVIPSLNLVVSCPYVSYYLYLHTFMLFRSTCSWHFSVDNPPRVATDALNIHLVSCILYTMFHIAVRDWNSINSSIFIHPHIFISLMLDVVFLDLVTNLAVLFKIVCFFSSLQIGFYPPIPGSYSKFYLSTNHLLMLIYFFR